MENWSFQDRCEADLFVNVMDRPVCPVCGANVAVCLVCGANVAVCPVCRANVAVTKEYNIRRHYETKHQDKYKDLDMKQKLQKIEEMKRSLVSRQTMFTKAKSQSVAAVKASFIVVAEIAKSARPLMRESLSKSA